jgi:putative hydrolase of the HAD superfamily
MPASRDYAAVIFDLFGTLVRGAGDEAYEAFLRAMAAGVGADLDAFKRVWVSDEMRHRRATGDLSSPRAIVEATCDLLHLRPGDDALEATARIRLDAERAWLEPWSDTIEVLTLLRERGLLLGLMSDCTAEVDILWPEVPFGHLLDAVLLSCREGVRKPDPRFYALACERLGVDASGCLYVGDGASGELTGARRAGMDAVLIAVPGHEDNVLGREDARAWTGPRVTSLTGLIRLLKREDP